MKKLSILVIVIVVASAVVLTGCPQPVSAFDWGELSEPPAEPGLLDTYTHTDDGHTYMWTGNEWIRTSGEDGQDGQNGAPGAPGDDANATFWQVEVSSLDISWSLYNYLGRDANRFVWAVPELTQSVLDDGGVYVRMQLFDDTEPWQPLPMTWASADLLIYQNIMVEFVVGEIHIIAWDDDGVLTPGIHMLEATGWTVND